MGQGQIPFFPKVEQNQDFILSALKAGCWIVEGRSVKDTLHLFRRKSEVGWFPK
jgi:hypothetical protein